MSRSSKKKSVPAVQSVVEPVVEAGDKVKVESLPNFATAVAILALEGDCKDSRWDLRSLRSPENSSPLKRDLDAVFGSDGDKVNAVMHYCYQAVSKYIKSVQTWNAVAIPYLVCSYFIAQSAMREMTKDIDWRYIAELYLKGDNIDEVVSGICEHYTLKTPRTH